MDKKLILAKEALEKNGFKVKIFESTEELKKSLLEEIHPDESLAFGGSMTLEGLKIYEDLVDRGNEVYWHWKAENGKAELEAAKNADIYLASTNALTLDGKLMNRDGVGNRVSSMFYGHERVYIVAGRNKIVKNLKAAKKRIDTIAAPKNAKTLDVDTPCKTTGICSDCDSDDRICSIEVVMQKNPNGADTNIFLVNEDLGY